MLQDWLNKVLALARGCQGNVAVEFALVSPVFITLLVGLADYGLAARERSTMDAAVRSGLAVLLSDPSDTAGAITTAEAIAPDAAIDATVECVCTDGMVIDCESGTCSSGSPRRFVTVTASQNLTLMFPWPGFTDPLPLNSLATARAR